MGKRKLSYDEAVLLINRGILGVKQSYVCIDGLSKYSGDEYEVSDIVVGEKDIIIKVKRPDEPKIYITSYKFINEISRMNIDSLLEAYDLKKDKIIEITDKTDVVNTVIGKETAKILNIDLINGMRIILLNDANSKYLNKILTVKGVGEEIKLVANRGRPKKIR